MKPNQSYEEFTDNLYSTLKTHRTTAEAFREPEWYIPIKVYKKQHLISSEAFWIVFCSGLMMGALVTFLIIG